MAHILIGWELGAYGGHLARIRRIGAALAEAGHRVTLALQRIDAPGLRDEPWVTRIWQAPVWPSLIGSVGRAVAGASATHGDILASAGLARPGTFGRLVAAWDPILAAEQPDVVVGDYAPALLCAARGQAPLVAVSDAFDLPPVHLQRLPSLTGRPPAVDEAWLVEEANAGLAFAGRPPVTALSQLFAADLPLPCSFPMLDPYAAWRVTPVYRPFIDPGTIGVARQPRMADEVFAYWPGTGEGTMALWQALASLGQPVRVHAPQLTGADHHWLTGKGLIVEPQPVPFHRIAERSRLLVSHGGVGFVSNGVMAGLPQLVIPLDLQKQLIGEAVARAGAGRLVPFEADAPTIAAAVEAVASDPAIVGRARHLGDGLAAAPGTSPELAVVAAVAEWTR